MNETDLIERHLTLVDKIIQKEGHIAPRPFDHDDLQSAGYEALVKAARSFDSTKIPMEHFGAFATLRIKGALVDEIRHLRWQKRKPYNGQVQVSLQELDNYPNWSELEPALYDQMLSECPPRQREALSMRLEGYTAIEIGERLGVTGSRASQLIHSLRDRYDEGTSQS